MSGPPGRSRRPPPLQERSQSQNNSHAIRIVPYSPPRLDPEQQQQGRSASQSSSTSAAAAATAAQSPLQQRPPSFQRPPSLQLQQPQQQGQQLQRGNRGNEDDQGSDAGASSRTKRSGQDFKGYASSQGSRGSQGSALSSPSSSAVLLAGAKDDVVSGTKPASGGEGPRTPRTPPPPGPAGLPGAAGPAIRSPTIRSVVNAPALNAPAAALPTAARGPAAAVPPVVPPPRLQGLRSPRSPTAASTVSAAAQGDDANTIADAARSALFVPPSPAPAVRPRSRRRNFVALHSDNKTFSLVSGRGSWTGSGSDSVTSGSAGGRPSDFSSSVGSASVVTSPLLSMSTLGTSSSHERLSDAFLSDAFSSDDRPSRPSSTRPSSPLTTADTNPDRAHFPQLGYPLHTPLTPLDAPPNVPIEPNEPPNPLNPLDDPHTPSNSTAAEGTTQLAADLITAFTPSASSSPWNYRMLGGVRKVPKTPDPKHRTIAHLQQQSSSNREHGAAALSPLLEASSTASPSTTPEREPEPEPESERERERLQDDDAEDEDEDEDEEDRDDTLSTFPATAPPRPLVPKESFASAQTTSTTSERTNYKVYGHSSPAQQSSDSLRPSTGESNVQLIGDSSFAAPQFDSSPFRPPGSSGSDVNYVLHGDPSPSPSASLARRQPRPKFSQESLVVPPLQPSRKKSYEKFGYYKSRSRENLRRANSSKSLKSISSIIASEAAQPFFVAPAFFAASSPFPPSSSFPSSSTAAAGPSGTSSADRPLPQSPQQQQMVDAHPHQWSSQLSTVMSESEGGSEQGGSPSRSVSRATGSGSGERRRGSTGWASSTHSRQMLSISSSLAAQFDENRSSQSRSQSHSHSQSHSDSLERPQPTYARPGGGNSAGPSRTVRDQDEHGDGLADLHNLSSHPSRSGLSAFFNSSSNDSSSRNIHSSGSSRAGSFTSASLPMWARLYYGSGERRYQYQLSAPSVSDLSEGGSRPGSAFRGGGDTSSPSTDHFPLSLYSPRRRGKEVQQQQQQQQHPQRQFAQAGPSNRPGTEGSMDITVMPPAASQHGFRPALRKKTSSIWSPHLRLDRRASRYSMWDPPSVSWSTESGILGRRNAQVVLFIVGFVFPFAWMIAAFLPLPANPQLLMVERDNSQSELGVTEAFSRRVVSTDENRYHSAKWWRTLNRCMSVVGLIIIGVVVGLVVLGVQQGWYQRP